MLVVKLAEADGHFAAAGAGSSDNHERARGFHIVVTAETVVRVDEIHIRRVAVDCVVAVSGNPHSGKAVAESVGAALAVVVGYHHRAYQKASLLELCAKTQHVHIVGYSKVAAYLVFLDIDRAYHYHDLGMVTELTKHTKLAVRLETRQHAACMMVVEKFASELEVKLVAELGYTLLDVFGLDFEIFLVIKTVFHNGLQN